jgi:hypothetical protein
VEFLAIRVKQVSIPLVGPRRPTGAYDSGPPLDGVAAMHYTGMAAMRMQAHLDYDLVIVGIAVVASIAALWLVFSITRLWQIVASALVMGLAVCGMHTTPDRRRSCGTPLRCRPRWSGSRPRSWPT